MLWLASLCAAAQVLNATSHRHCKDLSGLSVGDECKSSWHHLRPLLRPTQRSVGWAWVFRIQLTAMSSKDDAQEEMDNKAIPVVLVDHVAYILDHHHHLAALDLSGHEKVDVTLHVSCNLSGTPTDELWQILASHGWAYLYDRPTTSPYALPTPIQPSDLPSTLSFRTGNVTMSDDIWRALSGFSRKVSSCVGCLDGELDHGAAYNCRGCGRNHNYACRAYNRICESKRGQSIPFFEYRWAYFFNDAATVNRSLWGSDRAAETFAIALAALTSPSPYHPVTKIDDWKAAAALLVPLSRGPSAGAYSVDSSMGAMSGPLPGYHAGMGPIEDEDPDCDLPEC